MQVWGKGVVTRYTVLTELEMMDTSSYRNFLRMDSTCFEDLLIKISPQITYNDTNMRDAIPETSSNIKILSNRSVVNY